MSDRTALIARKQEVRRKIEQTQRRLEQERSQAAPAAKQIRRLESELEALMAQEHSLRLAIDRSSR